MRYTFSSRFIGTVTAAALAVTAITAAPAYADRDDRAARAIATILGLAVVGAIINDNRHDKKARRNEHVQPVRKKHANIVRKQHNNGYVQRRQQVQPKSLPKRVQRKSQPSRVNQKLLPQRCFNSVNTRRGQVHMFGRRCLERNYRAVNRLPQQCFQRVRTSQGTRTGFDARCLRQNGYRLAR
jgi:hypothetical protein